MKFITDKSTLSKAIESIGTRGKKMDNDIHTAGCSCLLHIREHGDPSLLIRLIEVLPKSSRRKAFNHWAGKHAPIEITDNKSGVDVKVMKGHKPEQYKIDEAAATPFWEYTAEKDPQPMTLEAFTKMLKGIADGGSKSRPASPEAKDAAERALAILIA